MAGETEQLVVSLEARIRDFERNFQRASRTADTNFGAIERRAKRSADQLEQTMGGSASRVGAVISSFGKGLAGGILGGLTAAGLQQIVSQIGKVAEGVAMIGSNAKMAGISTKSFQELSFVADQNRISVEALADGMKELSLRADEFIFTGKGSGAEAFQRLGFSAEELKEKLKDPSALLVDIIARLEQLDRASRIRIADEVFGGQAGERFVELVDRGAASIRQQIEEANRLGIVLNDDIIQRADEIDRKYKLIARTIDTKVKAAIVNVVTLMRDWVDSFNEIEEQQSRTVQLGLSSIYQQIQDAKERLEQLELDRKAFPGDAAIDLNIDRQKQLIEELTQEAMRLRDILDRRNGYRDNFIYETGQSAGGATPNVKALNEALANSNNAGHNAAAGLKTFTEAINALKKEIPGLAEQLADIDARTRIDAIYRQALSKAKTDLEVRQAAELRDQALAALSSKGAREAANKGFLDLIGYAEGTDKGRGYNETLGYGKFTGGDRNLVGMTLDEIDALQEQMLAQTSALPKDDPYYNSSAIGRYQITRRTLRGLRSQLGLSGSEYFDAGMQDRLAQELMRRRGNNPDALRNEWEGLRRIDDATIKGAYNGTSVQMPAVDLSVTQKNDALQRQAENYKRIVDGAREFTAEQNNERQALSMTTQQASAFRFEQEMLNQAQRAGIALTPQQRAEISQLAQGMAEAEQHTLRFAQSQEQAQQVAQYFGNMAGDALTGLITGTMTAEQALQRLISSLAQAVLQAALLGQGPLAGIFGSGGTSAGGIGGIIGGILGLADGGHVSGPGTSTSDSIPAMLSDGEFVVRASQAKRHRHLLEAINTGRVGAFAEGGSVGTAGGLARSIGATANNTFAPSIAINIEGGSRGEEADQELAGKLGEQLEAVLNQKMQEFASNQMRAGGMFNRGNLA
ncbi:phage tail tape measure protein [Phyllobacterium phragmitis]|uniref:Phage tail tape measure protein domain-containing protein n=1 Tax=Phyllobacterium phragmitis TaxID=2670329 RepID=A0ABQ0GYI0_9HYPH